MPPKTFLLAAVFLGACGPDFTLESADSLRKAPEQSSKRKPTATSYVLKTTDAVGQTWKTGFSVYSTYTLFIATEIPAGVEGHHLEAVTLIAPGGMIYQRLDVGIAIGVPAMDTEQQAEQTSSGWRVWTSIPVAATAIAQQNLVGPWSAELRVDSATSASARCSFSLF